MKKKSYSRHGLTRTAEHNTWHGMMQRCYYPGHVKYSDYGGRGIKVCERWHSFPNFLKDMGIKPSSRHTIERKSGNGDYEPANCVWATRGEQMNNRRNNINIALNGKTQSLARWCRELNLPFKRVQARIRQLGWDPVRALIQPRDKRGGNGQHK